MVDAKAYGDIGIVGGGADYNFAGAGREMHRSLVTGGKETGGFDHDLHAEFSPWELGGIAFRIDFECMPVDHQGVALGLDALAEGAVDGVVFQQVSQSVGVGNVIDGDDLEVFLFESGTIEHAANTAEAINCDLDRHGNPPEAKK